MRDRINPALIGGFVLGAVVLAVFGIAFFGAGQFDRKAHKFVVYFDDSVKGLAVGSPVILRGVQVGSVAEILALYDPEQDLIEIPVTIDLLEDAVGVVEGQADPNLGPQESVRMLIDNGMRAQLVQQSFVTGQMVVELGFHPFTTARYIGGDDSRYPEIPSIPSLSSQIEDTITSLSRTLPGVIENTNKLLDRVSLFFTEERFEKADHLLDNLDKFADALGDGEGDIRTVLSEMAEAMTNIHAATDRLDGIMDSVEVTMTDVSDTAASAKGLIADNREAVTATFSEIKQTAASFRQTSNKVAELLTDNEDAINDFVEGGLYDLQVLIVDTNTMVNSINRLAEQMERDPARFLFGDKTEGVRTE